MWFAILFSSAADCEQATLATCLLELNAPGTKRTAQDFAACAADSTAQSCADWQGNSPTSCVKAGTLALGAGCEFDSQCVSTFCERVEGSWCGACKALGAAGAACDPQQVSCVSGLLCAYGCASGSSCAAAEMLFRCAEPRAQGATCNSVTQCAIGLTCSGGVCSPGNLGVGDVCDPSVSRICSITDDLSCVTDAAGSTCVKNAYALADQACNTATANHCAGLGACDGADGALVPAGPGICRAPGGVGEACSSDHLCRQPALCFGGVCTAPVEANTCH